MKNIIKKASIGAFAMLSLSLASCNDWLDVKMEDKVMENVLFSDYKGYMAALNGVYLGMNDVYSDYLTFGALDVMAQYYNVTEENNHTMRQWMRYRYPELESTNYHLWSRIYELIADDNAIIEHTERDAVLNPTQNAIIRGEALALRAFLHFDLLRLYGPIYQNNPAEVCIPYQNSSSREIQPMRPASEILDLIIADLEEAAETLKDYDPIITNGTGNTATEDNGVSAYDMSFRQLRMNYYAVLGELARAYLWKGDRANAYRLAKNEIIDKVTTEDLEVFPWTTKAATEEQGRPDLIFSSEVMFSLYNSKREDAFDSRFAENLARASRLTFYGATLVGDSKVQFFYDDPNDLRIKQWKVVEPSQSEIREAEENGTTAETSLAFTKFADFTNDATAAPVSTYRYMQPLMRLSEMYLIAAECTNDTDEAFELINTIRIHRECQDVAPVDLNRAILYEFAREVIGEGQLFYFYKRHASTELISGTEADGLFSMTMANYVFPIPEEELSKRVLVDGK